MSKSELINKIKAIIEIDGEEITDGQCLDEIIELIENEENYK